MTRRGVALGGAGVAAFALAVRATWVEPRRLVVRRRTLELERWPRALDGLRVALVSDLHAGAPHVDAERVGRVVERTNALACDLVLLLGDFIDPAVHGGTPVAPEVVARRLGELRAPLGAFAVLGNHDWLHDGRRVARALSDAGVPVLEDDARELSARGAPLWVAGLADLREREPDLQATLAAVPEGDPVLLLSHDPDIFPRVPARVALTVSGHTHGGQVDVPVLRRLVIPSRYGDRYASGHVAEGGRQLYVTSGIGTSGWPLRLRRPPEIVVLELRSTGR